MKKVLTKLISAVLTTIILFSVCGCNGCGRLTLYESDYYIYIVSEKRNTVSILGLTDKGREQEYLIIPEFIDDRRVADMGCTIRGSVNDIEEKYGDKKYAQFTSDKLKKVFITSYVTINKSSMVDPLFKQSPNYEATLYIYNFDINKISLSKIPGYFTRLKRIELGDEYYPYRRAANVSYYYNYEKSPNDGYYWLDNCKYGSKIEYIPPIPQREGYTFEGWYKEAECINEWDYDKDTLPEVQYDENIEYPLNNEIYQETILYAKWIPEETSSDTEQ